ncbi:MAG: polymerase subunit alpha [Bacteroidota bacterium]|jgi:DNA polymerase-3 subunit alpha|nr:polymerase subunit alpha [Bacteroidota bacterium]
MNFSHLHVHTQFSLLDGAADVGSLYKKAVNDNMPGLAITDHGNMFGVFKFVAEAGKYNTPENPNKIKPIVGCEFYLVNDRHKRQFTKEDKDVRYHQLFLAKNAEGYANLVKLCSLGYMEGLYGKYPRIDKELVLKYHKGLIATTCCLGASVPRTILKKGEDEGEKEFKWWLDIFGEDYYVELQRHDIPEQNKVNEVLLRFAAKHNVKIIASNDSHYVDQADSNAHDILLCINTGEKQSTPTMKDFDDDVSMKGKRFAFYNDQFYFKKTDEMTQLFSDLPQAIDNTNEIVSKISPLKLKQDIMLPNYVIPPGFATQDEYLHHITYMGAKERYKEITPEVEERLNFELFTIKTMGFAGYFLIVADFIKAGRDLGVLIGPGRGSAAGSAVAYTIGITNIDPIKYNLLFERFLNPDRKSMPDIDTDFDDEGRQKVIDYVVDKYGKNQVAQIVTYGTMAAKMSIKDVARVLDLPLQESNFLAKMVPERPGISLKRVLTAPMTGDESLEDKEGLGKDELEEIKKLRAIMAGDDMAARVLKEALILEGSVRGTGIHAAGIIIAPKDLTDIIPVATSKESDLLITQFDGKVIEDAGVIKMDFLGLKTLTIIRDALKMIKQNHGVDIVIDDIPLDDQKTFELYQRGDTNGTFQFESAGMQKYLKELKPDKFADLIAMNALYRPGPIEYIPNFIKRKHGIEPVTYDLEDMKEYLEDTYGITVYQEQVMLLSQKLANFTKGDADVLRKAMGKKDKKTLDKLKPQFIENASKNGHKAATLEKVWTDWEKFAQYAFNKSHSTCYAFVAFQTAYLKAHYPGEYMASVLTHNLSNIDKITFFMDECKRSGVPVLGPDVNESSYQFSVNKKGEIRFGMGAVKGVGEAAVQSIVEEREKNGPYKSIFDLVRRINLRAANKKTFESLAFAGGFDSFGINRSTYFFTEGNDNINFLEKTIRYGNGHQDGLNSAQVSLFGEESAVDMPEPTIPVCEPWGNIEQLKYEKDVVGFYISGHPLDTYKLEMDNFCIHQISDMKKIEEYKNKDLVFGGVVTGIHNGITKTGNPWGKIIIEDYNESSEIAFFGEDYVKFKQYMVNGLFLFIRGKVSERYRGSGNFEFKVSTIQLLSELRDKLARSITIQVPLRSLNDEFISVVNNIITENAKVESRQCTLRFKIVDQEENITVELPSKRIKVSPNNEFLGMLKDKQLDFKLN